MVIYLSKNAVDKLNTDNRKCIKIKVFFGGCNGFKYEFSFPNNHHVQDGHTLFKQDDISLIVDDFTLSKIDEATVDFTESLLEEKFFVKSNNFKRTCHCGTSFKS